MPSTRKRSVAASPSGTTSRSRLADARKRPTAPEKPAASGSGSTVTVSGFVARSTAPAGVEEALRARPMRKVAAGIVSVPAFVGKSSFLRNGKRR